MRAGPVKNVRHAPITRREMLRGMAAAGGLLMGAGWPVDAVAQDSQPATSRPLQPVPLGTQLPWLVREPHRSRVVDARSDRILSGTNIDTLLLESMLQRSLQTLTGAESMPDAWRAILGPAERIAIKFNSVGASLIGTNDDVARALVRHLTRVGYRPDQITLIEVPQYLTNELETRAPAPGWGETIRVGDSAEPVAHYLLEADAVINVPLLKTHQIAGVSGAMKNISHAVVRHPARYHANGCSPFIGQIIYSQEVSSKLRLTVLNALRIVVDRGPDAHNEDLVEYGGLLTGFDPVAVDSVGLSLLLVERRRRGLEEPVLTRYLEAAGDIGVGRWRPADIERIPLQWVSGSPPESGR